MIHKWLDSGKQKSSVLWPRSMAVDTHVVALLVLLTVIRCSGTYKYTLSDLIDNSSFFSLIVIIAIVCFSPTVYLSKFFLNKGFEDRWFVLFFWGGGGVSVGVSTQTAFITHANITMHTVSLSHALQMGNHYNAQINMQTNNRNNYGKPSPFSQCGCHLRTKASFKELNDPCTLMLRENVKGD